MGFFKREKKTQQPQQSLKSAREPSNVVDIPKKTSNPKVVPVKDDFSYSLKDYNIIKGHFQTNEPQCSGYDVSPMVEEIIRDFSIQYMSSIKSEIDKSIQPICESIAEMSERLGKLDEKFTTKVKTKNVPSLIKLIQDLEQRVCSIEKMHKIEQEEMKRQGKLLDESVDYSKELIKKTISYSQHQSKIEELEIEHKKEIRQLKEDHQKEIDKLNKKMDKMTLDSELETKLNIEKILSLVEDLTFKGNSTVKKGAFSIPGKEIPGGVHLNTVAYETIKFSSFLCSSGYENTIVQLIESIRNQCNVNQCYLDYNHQTNVNEFKSGDRVLFIRYCGSSRFESSEASLLLEKGCKLVFILLTYGEKTKEITLPTQFQTCPYIQIPISGTNVHSTQDLIGMDEEKQSKLFKLVFGNFVSSSE